MSACLRGFNLTATRRERDKRWNSTVAVLMYDMWLQLTWWPVLLMEMRMETGTGSLWLQSQALLTWINLLFIHGNCNVVLKSLGSRIILFRIFSSNSASKLLSESLHIFYQEIFTKRSLSQCYWTFFLFISEKLV